MKSQTNSSAIDILKLQFKSDSCKQNIMEEVLTLNFEKALGNFQFSSIQNRKDCYGNAKITRILDVSAMIKTLKMYLIIQA